MFAFELTGTGESLRASELESDEMEPDRKVLQENRPELSPLTHPWVKLFSPQVKKFTWASVSDPFTLLV